MGRTTQVLVGGALVAAFAAAAWQAGALDLLDNSDGAIAACEEATKRRLRSPSSYRRVAAKFTRG